MKKDVPGLLMHVASHPGMMSKGIYEQGKVSLCVSYKLFGLSFFERKLQHARDGTSRMQVCTPFFVVFVVKFVSVY